MESAMPRVAGGARDGCANGIVSGMRASGDGRCGSRGREAATAAQINANSVSRVSQPKTDARRKSRPAFAKLWMPAKKLAAAATDVIDPAMQVAAHMDELRLASAIPPVNPRSTFAKSLRP